MTNEITQNNTNLSFGNSGNMFEVMDKAYKFAEIMAGSNLLPNHYKNNVPNCFIAIQSAFRIGIDPMLYMQNTYVVGGKLGMGTSFAVSLANMSGKFKSGITYNVEGEGNNMAATAYATLKNGEVIQYTVSMQMAMADGWTKNAKYKSLPDLMLRYRAATLLIRTHIPEVLNGLHTTEELEDVQAATKDITPKPSGSRVDQLKAKLRSDLGKEDNAEPVKTVNQTEENITESEPNNPSKTEDISDDLNEKIQKVLQLIDKHKISNDTINKWLDKAKVTSFFALDQDKVDGILKFINDKYE